MDLRHNEGGSAGNVTSDNDLVSVEISFRLPRYLHRELKEAAKAQTISMSSLLRIIVLDFARGRFEEAQR